MFDADCFIQDMRAIRAKNLTDHLMHIVGKYITNEEDDLKRFATRDLMDFLYNSGADIVTDDMRRECGLPQRDKKGWTVEEMYVLEARRLEAMKMPMGYVQPIRPS